MNAQLLIANMRFLRQSKSLSQSKVALSLQVELKRYQAWEEGRAQPDIDLLVSIAKVHEISLDDLMKKDLKKEMVS